jgi:hypothetical protein
VHLNRLTLVAGDKPKHETIKAEYSATEGTSIERLVESLRTVPGFLSIDQVVLHFDRGPTDDFDSEDGDSAYAGGDEDAEENGSLTELKLG